MSEYTLYSECDWCHQEDCHCRREIGSIQVQSPRPDQVEAVTALLEALKKVQTANLRIVVTEYEGMFVLDANQMCEAQDASWNDRSYCPPSYIDVLKERDQVVAQVQRNDDLAFHTVLCGQ